MSEGRQIRLIENSDGTWIARDLSMNVSAQGKTRDSAFAALDDVIPTVAGTSGHEPSDEQLRELGVDPEAARSQDELPYVLE